MFRISFLSIEGIVLMFERHSCIIFSACIWFLLITCCVLWLRFGPVSPGKQTSTHTERQTAFVPILLAQHVRNTAREGAQNTHHWCALTMPLMNGCCNDERDPAWSIPLSVAVSVRPDHEMKCMFCALFAVFPHVVINWSQIWWIWRPRP